MADRVPWRYAHQPDDDTADVPDVPRAPWRWAVQAATFRDDGILFAADGHIVIADLKGAWNQQQREREAVTGEAPRKLLPPTSEAVRALVAAAPELHDALEWALRVISYENPGYVSPGHAKARALLDRLKREG